MSLISVLYEHHQVLWHLARDEISRVDEDSPQWSLLFHEGDWLAGWCTQIMANGSIRSEEIPQLVGFPALNDTGPHAAWIAEIRTRQPPLFAYVTSIELIRLALLKEIGRTP